MKRIQPELYVLNAMQVTIAIRNIQCTQHVENTQIIERNNLIDNTQAIDWRLYCTNIPLLSRALVKYTECRV